jgi:hypothetical protein
LRAVQVDTTATDATERTNLLSNFALPSSGAAPHNLDLDRIRNESRIDGPANAPRNTLTSGKAVGDNGLSRPISISRQTVNDPERQPLRDAFSAEDNQAGLPKYGSIVGSPTIEPEGKPKRKPVRFDVPDAAPRPLSQFERKPSPLASTSNLLAAEARENKNPSRSILPERNASVFQFQPKPKIENSLSIKRLMSFGGNRTSSSDTLPLEALRELDTRQDEFFDFLDSELDKIEKFYKVKEDQATERLKVIREQLHVMRDCHIEELVKARTDSIRARSKSDTLHGDETDSVGTSMSRSWLTAMDNALESARHTGFGKSAKGVGNPSSEVDGHLDHVRHSTANEIPYRTAKLKLKAAMQEFYRGLELLKSYALLNRKAFRKMNKKYDKAVNGPPTLQYMSDHVNGAYFIKSHVLRDHIRAVEDLYARYFEGGNYKIASSKLRAIIDRPNDYNGVVFRNGLMASTGLWFAIAGLNSASQLLHHPDPTLALNTNFLLQVSTL